MNKSGIGEDTHNGSSIKHSIPSSTPIAKTLNTGYFSITINKPTINPRHLLQKPHPSRFRLIGLSSKMHIHALIKTKKKYE